MNDLEHFGRVARHLTPPRRVVPETLTECGPMTAEQIAECWRHRDPDLSSRVLQRLSRIVSQSLWNLDMVFED